MIKYMIIDDEHIAHDIIKSYCDLLPNLKLMKQCYDALEALDYLNLNSIDLIFLDLNMPQLKGFEFLKLLSNPPKVIVTTAYQEFALEGYELNVQDYLLKPFSFERFLKAINKTFGSTSLQVNKKSTEKTENKRIFLKSNRKYIQVLVEKILFLEAYGNYSKIYTSDEVIVIREKFSELLVQLADADVVQVHKSFAVVTSHIKEIEANRIIILDHVIPIGTSYKNNVRILLK